MGLTTIGSVLSPFQDGNLDFETGAILAGYMAIGVTFLYTLIEAWMTRDGRTVFSVSTNMKATIGLLWSLCLVCVIAWILSGRAVMELGLVSRVDWRTDLAWGIVILVAGYIIGSSVWSTRNQSARQEIGEALSKAEGMQLVWPKTRGQAGLFASMSVTAGITEEIIFRGFVLISLSWVMPLWVAALVSIALFIAFHAYQGVSGMVRIAPISVILTVLVVLGGSLWPAIILHSLVNLSALVMFWRCRAISAPA
jgi:membrane protease YdiL (CAAX protease family)